MSLLPIFRWAGGKRQMLKRLQPFIPVNYNIYYEPFFGGGALFFHLEPKRAFLNDANRSLMNAYEMLAEHHDDVMGIVLEMLYSFSSEQYYAARGRYNELRRHLDSNEPNGNLIELAALFIYLNRTNFNGLWRENQSGDYNTPIGKFNTSPTINVSNVNNVAGLLQHSIVSSTDFEVTTREASSGDFVYFDPPYDKKNFKTFDKFVAGGFSTADQQRLAFVFHELADKGVQVIMSNSDTPLIRKLYGDMFIHMTHERRSINSDPEKRNGVETLIITSFVN